MKYLLELFVLGTLAWQIEGQGSLRCRRCIGASNLDECTFSVPCSGGEICYMDEVITEQLSIEYNGGCRPRDVCHKGGAGIGKRSVGEKRAGGLIACSKCCDKDNGKDPECNTKLCGLRPTSRNISQCYHCADDTIGGGTAVDDPIKCTRLTTCQSDQFCGAETFRLSDNDSFRFSCLSKGICTLLTQEALKRMKECKDNGNDPETCGLKRETAGTKLCSACCGDALCNSGTCQDTLDRLYNLWDGKVLDFQTLKTNATKSTTKATPPTTPTTKATPPTTPTTKATPPTTPTTKATPPTTPTTKATPPTTPTTKATPPTTPTTKATPPTTPTTKATPPTTPTTKATPPTTPTTKATPPTTPTTKATPPTTPTTKATPPTTPTTKATPPTVATTQATPPTANTTTPASG